MKLLFQVKRDIFHDPRYDSVGSSSRREELFLTYVKEFSGMSSEQHSQFQDEKGVVAPDVQLEDRKARAIREREEKVKSMREKVTGKIELSKIGIDIEEGERNFL